MINRIKHLINSFLGHCGYRINRIPSIPWTRNPMSLHTIMKNPGAILELNFDYVLNHHLSHVKPQEFFFIQIGAFDGITNDALHIYIKRYDWRGVLLEPQPNPFQRLKENYRDQSQLVLLNAVIADVDGTRDLFVLREEENLPEWSRQIASLKRENVLKHRDGIPDYEITESIPNINDLLEIHKTKSMTFETLINQFKIDRIDLLQIDAEGYDAELIKMFNFELLKPHIVRYEHMHLKKEEQEATLRLLIMNGYRVTFEFTDTVAYLEPAR